LFKIFILSIFFPEECPDKPILVVTGPQGSGKTTLFEKLKWVIGDWVNIASTINPDNFSDIEAGCVSSRLFVLDNLETISQEFEDKICGIVTGGEIIKRELYTTNKMVKYIPESFFAITCVEPTIKTSPFADRIIIFDVYPRESFALPLAEIKNKIEDEKKYVIRIILEYIQKIIPYVITERKSVDFRMASWADLGRRIAMAEGQEERWSRILKMLKDIQSYQILNDSPITDYVLEFLNTERAKDPTGFTVKDIYDWASETYGNKTPFKNLKALNRYFVNMREALKNIYGLKMERDTHGRTVRYYLKQMIKEEELPF